ncbi:MAG: hypothetical protein LW875_05615, partial [Proteobacteria bacterium]|nr:hypothetical protein [Pseudomonadota bacterium]
MHELVSGEILNFVENPEMDMASNYFLAMSDLEREKSGESKFFWAFLRDVGLRVHREFFEDFNFHDGFQIVNQYGQLVYFSTNIALKLRYDFST